MNRKHVVKSILSVMLTFAMIFGTVQLPFAPESVVVHAETVDSGTCGNNLTWTLDNAGTLTISGTGAMAEFGSSSNVPWKSIRDSVKNIVITEGVTSISEDAFSNHSNLESVSIAESVTNIGKQAFYRCVKLAGINIPKNVSRIEPDAFCECTVLSAITVDVANSSYASEDGVLFNKDKTILVRYPEGKSDSSYCIPNTVTIIGEYAFYWSSLTLTEVTIPNSVTNIKKYAFYCCESLTAISIPDSVTSIGDMAFDDCGVTTITIPDSVTSIGLCAFEACQDLETAMIGVGVKSIGNSAFRYCYSLKNVYAPNGLDLSNCNIRNDATIKTYYAVKLAPTNHGTVTVSGGDVQDCGAYFTNGGTATLTVTPDDGYVVKSVTYNDGTDHILEKANDGTYSFTMPTNKHVTVTAEFALEAIKYIDENGVEQECTEYAVLEGEEVGLQTTLEGGWYVVKDTNPNGVDAAYTGNVLITGAANIILCDGAEMSVDVTSGNAIEGTSALAIYGQSGQSGKLTVSNKVSNYSSIYMHEAPITINGGDIVIDGTVNMQPVFVVGAELTINDGHISTTKEIYASLGITINGGQVEAGKINKTGGSLKLGYRKATDYIKAGAYSSASTTVANGQAFLTDDNPRVLIKGDVPTVGEGNEKHSTIDKKKLVPALKLTMAGNISNGSISVSNSIEDNGVYYAAVGDIVALTVTPDNNTHIVGEVKYNDGEDHIITPDSNGDYSFTMPGKNVTVTAEFIPDILSMSGEANYKAYDGHTLTGSTTGTVTIADKATVTLSTATISGGIICEGDATIILAGENTVTAPDAGLNVSSHAGIYVPQSKNLTINGDGKLNATGGYYGAGIGGENGKSCGSITINNGVVIATGGDYGAGIGGARGASFDNIEINGGIVTAQGGTNAAGIGGGGYTGGTGGNIAITGGKVDAKGGRFATGIGCGGEGSCKDILIEGGDITANGGEGAAGIGGACADKESVKCSKITITNGIKSLKAAPGNDWEIAIGKGKIGGCGTVTIGDIEFQNDKIKGNPFVTKPFSISIEAGDGTGSMNSLKVMENVSDEYVLPDCTFTAPEGKAFKEWSVNIGNAGAVTKTAGESVTITGDTTVTATYVTIVEAPVAVADLIYDGKEQTGVVSGTGYTVTGNTATNAGTYKAKATLNDGYIWRDGTTEDKVIEWIIAKATPVKPADRTIDCNQTIKDVKLTPGFSFADATQELKTGSNEVKLKLDTDNYEAIDNLTIIVTKNDHKYGEPVYTWSEDGKTCTAKVVCENDATHIVSENAVVTSAVKNDSTTSLKGTTTYTATFKNELFKTQTKDVEDIPVKSGGTSGGTSGGSASGSTGGSGSSGSTGGSGSSGSTGGSGSSGGSAGGSASNTDNKDTTEKTTNADGSVTEKTTTTNTDGSKTETSKTTAKDGTITEAEKTTAKDGTVKETEKTTATDGTVTETQKTTTTDGTVIQTEKTTSTDGSVEEVEKTTSTDGTIVEKTSETDKDGSSVVSEKVTEKDGSSSETTVTVGSNGKAKSIVATDSDGKKDSQTVAFDVKGNKATVSSIDTSTGKVTIPETIEAPDGKTYTVTKLDKDAFDGQKLKELSLPETIKVINPKALENTGLKTLNLTGKNIKLKKNCLKNTNKNLVIKVTTKTEKRNIEKQLKKAGNPNAKVKVSKKKA